MPSRAERGGDPLRRCSGHPFVRCARSQSEKLSPTVGLCAAKMNAPSGRTTTSEFHLPCRKSVDAVVLCVDDGNRPVVIGDEDAISVSVDHDVVWIAGKRNSRDDAMHASDHRERVA